MKVQLVLPKCDNPGARLIRGWPQPLGILSIATFLRQSSPQHIIEILDGTVLSQQDIERMVDADVVGISTITRGYPNALSIARKAKSIGAKVVLGGQYATAMSHNILKNRDFIDVVIRYDGEVAFYKLVSGFDYEAIENLVFRKPDGSIHDNPIVLQNLADLPFPDRSFVNLELYDRNYANNIGGPFKRAGTIFSQRGCGWRSKLFGGCVFCAIPDYSWRLRKPTEFWEEVMILKEIGFDFLYDIADDIGARKSWLFELVRTKPNIDIYFRHYISANNICDETVNALVNLGTVQVFVGFESADKYTLSTMNKEATVEKNINALKVLNKYRMPLLASFVSGVPGESRESINRTFKFAEVVSEQPNIAGLHWDILKPIPGSKAYHMMLEHPVLGEKYRCEDLLDIEELRKDWVENYCSVDYEYLLDIENRARKLVEDVSTYAPITNV